MTLSSNGRRRLDALQVLSTREPDVRVSMPLRLKSRANARGAWQAHAGAHAAQRRLVQMALAKHRRRLIDATARGSLVVRLVRVAPRELDDDNLATAFKSVRDGIAECIGVDDRDARVTFIVDAESGTPKHHAITLEFYCP